MSEHMPPAAPSTLTLTIPKTIDGISLTEWGGVTVVGVVLAKTLGVRGLLGGVALYLLGYWVRGRRPAAGWSIPLPGPVMSFMPRPVIPGPDVINADEIV